MASLLAPSVIADDSSVASVGTMESATIDIDSLDFENDDVCFDSSKSFGTPSPSGSTPGVEQAMKSQSFAPRMVSLYDLEDATTRKLPESSNTPYDILKSKIQVKRTGISSPTSSLQHKISIADIHKETSVVAHQPKTPQVELTLASVFSKSSFQLQDTNTGCEEHSILLCLDNDLDSLGCGTDGLDDLDLDEDMFDDELASGTGEAAISPLPVVMNITPDLPVNEKKRSAGTFQVASVFGTPSAFFLQSVSDFPTPPTKKQRLPVSTVLHKACQQGASSSKIHAILKEDPKAAGQAASLYKTATVYDMAAGKMVQKTVREKYTYPLNLALANPKVEEETIHRLVQAAPHVMGLSDGSALQTPLHVLIQSHPNQVDLVDSFLLNTPNLCKRADRRGNLPLHTACQAGASETVIQHLCILYPEALHARNMDGVTPVQISQRNEACSDQVVNFLWSKLSEAHE